MQVPVLPGSGLLNSAEEAGTLADGIGYPVLLKVTNPRSPSIVLVVRHALGPSIRMPVTRERVIRPRRTTAPQHLSQLLSLDVSCCSGSRRQDHRTFRRASGDGRRRRHRHLHLPQPRGGRFAVLRGVAPGQGQLRRRRCEGLLMGNLSC